MLIDHEMTKLYSLFKLFCDFHGTRVLRDSISTSYKVGLAALGIGIMMNIGGVASPGWSLSMGLWMLWTKGECKAIPVSDKKVGLIVCEASSILGIIFYGFAFILGAIFLVLPMVGLVPKRELTYAAFALGLLGVGFTVICLTVWGIGFEVDLVVEGHMSFLEHSDLFYSFYLTAVSLLPILVGNVVIFSQGFRYIIPNAPT